MSQVLPERPRGLLIVDLGTQYAQLIARRLREAGTWCEIHPASRALEAARAMELAGIVLSGGPASVYADDAPEVPAGLLELGVPVLGICYGMQWMSRTLGGSVEGTGEREFGHTEIQLDSDHSALFAGIGGETIVWMSHGDKVTELPPGFHTLARSETCKHAAIGDDERLFYGVQFHPEVSHTARGKEVLANFVLDVCGLPGDWKAENIAEREIAKVRELVGETGEVILGLSGGVDSAVAAVIVHRAIGDRLHCIFVDNGLLRKGERELVEHAFRDHIGLDLTTVDARERFVSKLDGVDDPERKRKIIGYEFVEIFREEAKRFTDARFLGQGTLYPDVIESVAAHGGNTAVIKSHHNVGGLPDDLDMELVEPLRELFKDEVREVGRHLGLDERILMRQPFPGPGLAVRIAGAVTPERLELLREADAICTAEIEAVGAHEHLWQYFAVLLPVKSVLGAVPIDAPGITMVFGRQAGDDRRDKLENIDVGKPRFGAVGGEAMIVFEDVFIPNERVFLDGETEFTGDIVYRFAAHHRANYGACKTGLMDVLTGAVTYLAQIQGTANGSHVRDKITEMIHLSETLYSSSIACSVEGCATPSGAFLVDTMLANVCKQNVTRFHFEVARLAVDLAGGVIATLPSEHDLNSKDVGHLVKKYFSGVAGIPMEERMKIGRLIEAMTGGTAMVESMHGAGSPQAQRIMIFREGKLNEKIKLAKTLAGISQGDN